MNLIKKFVSMVLVDIILLTVVAYVVFNNPTGFPTGFMCALGILIATFILATSLLTVTDKTKNAYSGTSITIANLNQNEDVKILTNWKDAFGWSHAIIERQDGSVRYIYINPSQCESVVNNWIYRVKDRQLVSIKSI